MESYQRGQMTRAYSSSMAHNHKKLSRSLKISSQYTPLTKSYKYGNPELELLILPSLDKKSALSISLTTQRNTKFKLDKLGQKIQDLSAEIHNTRLQANETMKNIRFMHQLLVDNHLAKHKTELKQRADDLSRLIEITKRSNEDRFGCLRQGYINLWNQTQQMRQKLFDLSIRADKIQSIMGYNRALNN